MPTLLLLLSLIAQIRKGEKYGLQSKENLTIYHECQSFQFNCFLSVKQCVTQHFWLSLILLQELIEVDSEVVFELASYILQVRFCFLYELMLYAFVWISTMILIYLFVWFFG